MSNLATQASMDKLIGLMLQKSWQEIQNHELVARIWIEGIDGICTLSFHPEIPILSIPCDPDQIPFDISSMDVEQKEGFPTFIKIDMKNLDLYRSIIIDPKDEFTDKAPKNYIMGFELAHLANQIPGEIS